MKIKSLEYNKMVQHALRDVVRLALETTVEQGLPGEHHFFITFYTQKPGVIIPGFLLEKYPEEMTIILQHQFWDLKVNDHDFMVTLSFDNQIAEMTIPFSSLKAFIDPSVKFGLQFDTEDTLNPEKDNPIFSKEGWSVPNSPDQLNQENSFDGESRSAIDENVTERDTAEVVSLETFRKK